MINEKIATGFDCEPLPDGNVLIEFFGCDGKTFNKQVVTPEVIRHMPLVAVLTNVALTKEYEEAFGSKVQIVPDAISNPTSP